MGKKSIEENEAIQNGLERFLENELNQTTGQTTPKDNFPKKEDELSLIYGEEVTRPADIDIIPTNHERHVGTSASPVISTAPVSSKSPASRTVSRRDSEPERRKNRETDTGSNHSAAKTRKDNSPKNKMKHGKQKKEQEKKGKPKKKGSKIKRILIALAAVIAAFLFLLHLVVGNAYKKMTYEKSETLAHGALKEDGVINILLIGNDSREAGDDGRSDAMILLSVSKPAKKIFMTSLLRDMYVDIPGHDGNRLNAAYAYGGPELLCETIKQNLGIEVNRYVLVNFQAFANLVDAVGGVDLELSNEEVQWVNAYLNEYNLLEGREITTDYLDTSLSGELHLNGPQALAYCRNRYIGTDFGRTERQRKVLSAIMKKLPLASVTNSGEIVDGLFPNLTTNLSESECHNLSLQAGKFLTYETEQITIPADGTYSNASIRGMDVLEVDFAANRTVWEKTVLGK